MIYDLIFQQKFVPGCVEDGECLAVAPRGLSVVLGGVLVDGLRDEPDGRVQTH